MIFAASPGYALDSLIVNINQAAAIVNPSDPTDVRALIRFDLPTELDTTKFVTYAELRFGVSVAQRFERPIRLKVSPLTRQWSPQNMSWGGPWNHPGGDFADTISCIAHMDSSGQSNIRVDIARIIQYFVRGNIPNHGLIIRQHGNLRRPYGVTPNRFPGETIAQLAIYYVDMNPD
jgi:hypothetical protein